MRKIQILLVVWIMAVIVTACGQGETIVVPEEAVSEKVAPSTDETPSSVAKTSSQAESEVDEIPIQGEKIPPYALTLRDGTTVKLDQFEGQVVLMTFFTTW